MATVFGIGTYYAIRIKAGGEYRLNKNRDISDNSEENADDPNIIPTPQVTVAPTVEPEVEQIIEEVDPRVPVRARGIYVTSRAIMDRRDELIEIADTTEINTMVIDVKDDNGRITFNMDSEMARNIGATTNTISDIADLLKLLKEKEIYPIARIVAFKDPYLAEQRHDLAIKNKDGSLYRDNNGECWINPYEKEVWDYLIEVSTKAAEVGFMEIQFDYIRFSTGKGMSEAYFGPLRRKSRGYNYQFTKYAYEKLKPLGVFVSADVYGTIIAVI